MGADNTVVLSDRLDDHPAFLAWRRLSGAERPPTSVEILKPEKRKSTVYRMNGIGGKGKPLVAKRTKKEAIEHELRLYTGLLPALRIATLECYGSITVDDEVSWLFLEDGGDVWFSPQIPEHRALAFDWLARLHSWEVQAPSWLPDRGADYFRSVVATARQEVRSSLAHPSLSADDVAALEATLSHLDEVAEVWDVVVQTCLAVPPTLVHGDFVPKNVRVRGTGTRTELVALDWETAGVAPPAADLAMIPAEADRRRYFARVREVWPRVSWDDLEKLHEIGKLFRFLHCVFWETRSFRYSSVERAKTKMVSYERYLRRHLAENPWLYG